LSQLIIQHYLNDLQTLRSMRPDFSARVRLRNGMLMYAPPPSIKRRGSAHGEVAPSTW
jgi:hypothetical protein